MSVSEEKRKAVQNIIKGQNDVFEETFEFQDLNLKINMKLHAPTIIEQGRAMIAVEDALGGSKLEDVELKAFMNTVAVFNLCDEGTEVINIDHASGVEYPFPNYFSLDKYPNGYVVNIIGGAFWQWFRGFKG